MDTEKQTVIRNHMQHTYHMWLTRYTQTFNSSLHTVPYMSLCLTLSIPYEIQSVNPSSLNYSAGYLNFAHAFRKTRIFRELSQINLWNKQQFVGKETYIAQDALKMV